MPDKLPYAFPPKGRCNGVEPESAYAARAEEVQVQHINLEPAC